MTLEISSQPFNRQVSIRMMDSALQFSHVMDEQGIHLTSENTNLNGDPGHIRFQTLKDQTYQVVFK